MALIHTDMHVLALTAEYLRQDPKELGLKFSLAAVLYTDTILRFAQMLWDSGKIAVPPHWESNEYVKDLGATYPGVFETAEGWGGKLDTFRSKASEWISTEWPKIEANMAKDTQVKNTYLQHFFRDAYHHAQGRTSLFDKSTWIPNPLDFHISFLAEIEDKLCKAYDTAKKPLPSEEEIRVLAAGNLVSHYWILGQYVIAGVRFYRPARIRSSYLQRVTPTRLEQYIDDCVVGAIICGCTSRDAIIPRVLEEREKDQPRVDMLKSLLANEDKQEQDEILRDLKQKSKETKVSFGPINSTFGERPPITIGDVSWPDSDARIPVWLTELAQQTKGEPFQRVAYHLADLIGL